MLGGLRIIESVYCEEDGTPYQVRRTWRERLFTRPWRPLRTNRTVTPRIPTAYEMANGTIVAHPSIVKQLRAQAGRQETGQ